MSRGPSEAADGLLVATLAATRSADELWRLTQQLARAATIRELEGAEEDAQDGETQ